MANAFQLPPQTPFFQIKTLYNYKLVENINVIDRHSILHTQNQPMALEMSQKLPLNTHIESDRGF